MAESFIRFLKEDVIHQELTTPPTLEQNDVVDKHNRTILDQLCNMLYVNGVNKNFWGEATMIVI